MSLDRPPLTISYKFTSMNALLVVVTSVQLSVIAVWLLVDTSLDFSRLGLWSTYAFWFALLTLFGTDKVANRIFSITTEWRKFRSILITTLVVTSVLEVVVAQLFSDASFHCVNLERLLRGYSACLLVSYLFYRGVNYTSQVASLSKAESESRLLSLQSTIKPHFLFNSLNSVSELVQQDPDKAEEAIQSLAMLFRVSLENKELFHSLKNELRLCKRYVWLESLRYDYGININFSVVVQNEEQIIVPKLIVQPLLENAIKYSDKSSSSPPINVLVSEDSEVLCVKISNSVKDSADTRAGNGVAISNTRDRLVGLYDDQFKFTVRRVDGMHYLLIHIPKTVISTVDLQ